MKNCCDKDYNVIDAAIENLHLAVESLDYAKTCFEQFYQGKADISNSMISIDNLKSCIEIEIRILLETLEKNNG